MENTGERAGVSRTFSRTATYDRAGLVTNETTYTYLRDDAFTGTTARFNTQTLTYSYTEGAVWRGVVTAVTTTGTSDAWPEGGSTTAMAGTRTSYTYDWWEDARQATIVFDSDTGSGSNALNTSTFAYDLNGRIASVQIADARPRTVTFVTDAQGQVLSRTEQDNNPNLADPRDQYFYFNGQRIGQVTNNTEYTSTYHAEMYKRGWTGPTSPTPFRNGNYAQYGVDFDLAYEALTPNSVRSTGQAWTVRDGDTLAGIAAAVWGDASLWYLIAEHNGLTSASVLTAGQTLTVPAKVGNVHNTSETFRPYDPNKALGDLNPTQPRPPKKPGGCGVIGQVIAIAIAIVVTAYTAGALSGLFGVAANAAGGAALSAGGAALSGAAGTTLGTVGAAMSAAGASMTAAATFGAVAAGAIGGAVGALASQGFLIATGAQDRLDWKGVGLSALSAGIGNGLGIRMPGTIGGSKMGADLARGVTGNVLTQGVAVATGLQDRFDWSSVAVSAVTSAGFGSASRGIDRWAPEGGLLNQTVAGGASAFAGAATRSVLTGTSFGDNLIAVLPDVIGSTLGNAVMHGLAAQKFKAAPIESLGPDEYGNRYIVSPQDPQLSENFGPPTEIDDIVVWGRKKLPKKAAGCSGWVKGSTIGFETRWANPKTS